MTKHEPDIEQQYRKERKLLEDKYFRNELTEEQYLIQLQELEQDYKDSKE